MTDESCLVSYRPQPLDTSKIELGPDLEALVESLARNTHDVWASRRLADGWRHGPHRDDARKEHPGLVCYDELSEAEKDYDRDTAVQALKAVLALGYRIIKS